MKKNKKHPSEVYTAKVSWDEQGVPHSPDFDDIYFSRSSGLEETAYVFLNGNKLQEKFQQQPKRFNIGETGFGTGLNFLSAWQCWIKNGEPGELNFYSVEKFPLSRKDLAKSLSLWPELSNLSQALIEAYPPQPINGLHKMLFQDGKVTLSIFFGEASEGFRQLAPIAKAGPQVKSTVCSMGTSTPYIDAWFLDGFAPSKNPDMWTEDLFQAIKTLSHTGTSFATFTAAGAVRRGLIDAGFICQKRKGFGHKREMLVGEFQTESKPTEAVKTEIPTHFRQYKQQKIDAEDAWHLVPNTSLKTIKTCIVVGAGMAGSHTARALAKKGIKVTLIEKNADIAEEASGNIQGAVYAKLSPHQDPISRFNLSSLLFANHFYASQGLYHECGEQCGVLHFAKDERQRELYTGIAEHFDDDSFARWLDKDCSSRTAGLNAQYPGLFLPQAGWLAPRKLCQRLIEHPNISIILGKEVQALNYQNNRWHTYSNDEELIAEADAVVLCNAYEASLLPQSQHIPLKRIRGQVSHLPVSEVASKLKCVLCGDGYTPPPHNDQHAFGATFTLHNTEAEITHWDHQENLDKLAELSPEFASLVSTSQINDMSGKVGFRCTTPDYFPAAGPVADFDKMTERFAFLRKKANAVIDSTGIYHPHLYCNIGHGSRGLCYTPLCAELLASLMTGHFLPLARELYQHLHPARFIIRDLMRNKI